MPEIAIHTDSRPEYYEDVLTAVAAIYLFKSMVSGFPVGKG